MSPTPPNPHGTHAEKEAWMRAFQKDKPARLRRQREREAAARRLALLAPPTLPPGEQRHPESLIVRLAAELDYAMQGGIGPRQRWMIQE